MITENKHYDVFIAYSKHDLGEKCSDVIYSWLTEHYPLRVFLDKRSSNNTVGTTKELENSNSIILILTKDTLRKLEKDLVKEYVSEEDKPGLLRELDTISSHIKEELEEIKRNNKKASIEDTSTCKKIVAINIHEKDVTVGGNHFPNGFEESKYPLVSRKYKFLKHLSYIKAYYDGKFEINFKELKDSKALTERAKEIIKETDKIIEETGKTIVETDKKERRKKQLPQIIAYTAIILTALVFLLGQHKTINTYKKNFNNPVVLIGGGTAKAKFLDAYKPKNTDNIIFIHVPSELAWAVLKDKYKDSPDNTAVLLSTGSISIDPKEDKKLSKDKYRIADLQLDSVPLEIAIYPKHDTTYKKYTKEGTATIDIKKLREFIKTERDNRKRAVVVTTSQHSGTLSAYKSKMDSVNLETTPEMTPDRAGSLEEYIKDPGLRFAILLQNESYGHKDSNMVKRLTVVSGVDTIKLPIHIYCLVRIENGNGFFTFNFPNNRIKDLYHSLGWNKGHIDDCGKVINSDSLLTDNDTHLIIKLTRQ